MNVPQIAGSPHAHLSSIFLDQHNVLDHGPLEAVHKC